MSTMRTTGAFLLGAAVGASLGVLLAPDKGTATRKKVLDKTDELTSDAKDKYADLKNEAKNKYEEGKDYVKTKYREGKEKLNNMKSKGREKAEEVKTDLDNEFNQATTPDYTTAL